MRNNNERTGIFTILYITVLFFFWILVFFVERAVFFFVDREDSSFGFGDFFSCSFHALPMDASSAVYFLIPVFLVIVVGSFTKSNGWSDMPLKVINSAVAVFTSVIVFGDLFLYPYWGFRIDDTPLFYLRTPKDAAASASMFEMAAFVVLVILFSALLIWCLLKLHKRFFVKCSRGWSNLLLVLVLPVFVVLARGGVNVSTMNVGKVYFSDKQFLNHAAINANWNFIYSLEKTADYSSYYLLADGEAQSIFDTLSVGKDSEPDTFIFNGRPNVLLFIMEGFSGSACSLLGGVDAMHNVSRYAEEGVLFKNFYANSFRTDRGLAAILASYPGMPTTSLMKLAAKSQTVPMFPQDFHNNGFATSYYYGGDINFTNQNSFVHIAGYERVVSDKDFESKYLQSKWGALDGVLLDRLEKDFSKGLFVAPFFCTVQTSSSHEPYDVPYSHDSNQYVNSVMYADSCLGSFLDNLKASPYWDSLLVVILPDHATKYPENVLNHQKERYHIPMVWTGGAVKNHLVVEDFCSQIDLGATLVAQFGWETAKYPFSKNIFSKKSSKFAPYSFNNGFGYVTADGCASYDYGPQTVIKETDSELTKKGKAFMQVVHKDIERR
ncbi:MAG: sulfatase-like hydrolase/transferase [Paludibacteraceae bacterium]|nr:sulfatase-like hydrolase/transferase [Paludibacteraceae bacterium]